MFVVAEVECVCGRRFVGDISAAVRELLRSALLRNVDSDAEAEADTEVFCDELWTCREEFIRLDVKSSVPALR